MPAKPQPKPHAVLTPPTERKSSIPAAERVLMQPLPNESDDQKATRLRALRRERLLRIGDRRVSKAIKDLAAIANLATYKPSAEEVDEIMSALGETCAMVEARLRGVVKSSKTFSLRTIKSGQTA